MLILNVSVKFVSPLVVLKALLNFSVFQLRIKLLLPVNRPVKCFVDLAAINQSFYHPNMNMKTVSDCLLAACVYFSGIYCI